MVGLSKALVLDVIVSTHCFLMPMQPMREFMENFACSWVLHAAQIVFTASWSECWGMRAVAQILWVMCCHWAFPK